MTAQEFVKKYWPYAVEAAGNSRVLPQTILAAAALESAYAGSDLSSRYNNFFGRKPEKGYKGKVVNLKTKEFVNGKYITPIEPFKVYETPADSFRDYVKLLTGAARYSKVLAANTPQQQFIELQKAGYATDPKYAAVLTSVLNRFRPHLASLGVLVAVAGFFF